MVAHARWPQRSLPGARVALQHSTAPPATAVDGPGDRSRLLHTPDACRTAITPRASPDGGAPELVQGKLGSGLASTLGAVVDVAPRAQQPGALWVEKYHEGLRQGVQLEPVVGPPGRRRLSGVKIEALQDAAEPHALGVEEPRAVARFEHERCVCGGSGHGVILPRADEDSL